MLHLCLSPVGFMNFVCHENVNCTWLRVDCMKLLLLGWTLTMATTEDVISLSTTVHLPQRSVTVADRFCTQCYKTTSQ